MVVEPESVAPADHSEPSAPPAGGSAPIAAADPALPEPAEEDEGLRPIPDRLLTELTAWRTLALRDALGADPSTAFLALLHVLCLKLFYRYGSDSCLEIEAKSVMFGAQAPGLADTALAARVDERHRRWAAQLPAEPADLWAALIALGHDSREALFAHCVSLTLNALHEACNRRPRAMAHADRLAEILSLDMVTAGWIPTVDSFFGRVTKARIVEAVREVKGEAQADLIAPLKKGEMAARAEEILVGSGWLPEPLRTAGVASSFAAAAPGGETAQPLIAESAASEGVTALDHKADQDEPGAWTSAAHAIAAE